MIESADSFMAPQTSDFFAALNPKGVHTHGASWTNFHQQSSGDSKENADTLAIMKARPLGGKNQAGVQIQDKVLWLQLGLCNALSRAISHLGYIAPTPVQAQAIPVGLQGHDICARAVTGSGKTAAFLLPVLHRLLTTKPQENSLRKHIRSLIIVPSRELGMQCYDMTKELLQFTSSLQVALAIGGLALPAQEAALEQAPELVIATPGRLIDILKNHKGAKGGKYGPSINLSRVEVVVVDEIDQMLSVAMKDQLYEILALCPEERRQTLFFSATMTEEVDDFANEMLVRPKNIDVGGIALQSQLRQEFVRVETNLPKDFWYAKEDENTQTEGAVEATVNMSEEQIQNTSETAGEVHMSRIKTHYLLAICQAYYKKEVIIFCKYRTTAHRLAVLFRYLGLQAQDLHGDLSQEQRSTALQDFAAGRANFLFCTDVASRGIDMQGKHCVINFDMPATLTAYIHRVGRTARIGQSGIAVSLVNEDEDADIMRKIIAVSRKSNTHQDASVKRRQVRMEDLVAAKKEISVAFPKVKVHLATENLEKKLTHAENRMKKRLSREEMEDLVGQESKRQWCLSKGERQLRDEEALKTYKNESSRTQAEIDDELRDLDRREQGRLKKQKLERRKEAAKKDKAKDKEREVRKYFREKFANRVQKGMAKKVKKGQIRQARKQERSEKRIASGKKPKAHHGKVSMKKSRHAGHHAKAKKH